MLAIRFGVSFSACPPSGGVVAREAPPLLVLRGFSLPAFVRHVSVIRIGRGSVQLAQGDIETYYEGGSWKNKREGTDRAFGAGHSTKHEAEAAGREAAQSDRVEHVIKNQDGQIGSKNSYGNDPRNVPG